jgi:hypothetical protein
MKNEKRKRVEYKKQGVKGNGEKRVITVWFDFCSKCRSVGGGTQPGAGAGVGVG